MKHALALFALLLLPACRSAARPTPQLTPAEARQALAAARLTVLSAEPQLDELDKALWAARSRANPDYLTAEESDKLEFVWFRFSALHAALWEIAAAEHTPRQPGSDRARDVHAHLVASRAAFLLARHTASLVTTCGDDSVVTDFLDERHPRSGLARGTYLELCRAVTHQRVRRLWTASRMLDEALADPESELSQLAAEDEAARAWIAHDQELVRSAVTRMEVAIKNLPAATEPDFVRAGGDAFHGIGQWFGDELYAMRALAFKDVSRLKSPTASLIRFDEVQKRAIFDSLQVGDLIMTYTAGYMSDVFIPGAFKHGFVFVGTPQQRADAELTSQILPPDAAYDRNRVATNLARAERDDGRRANVIESVAEGVILNDLAYLLDTHVNRLLVLRPRLSNGARAAFVTEVFGYLGEEYDFCFDFADASRQVCTELIYRTLSGKDGIQFTLTVRGGHETLSADDIVNAFQRGAPFDFVLYAE